MNEANSINEVQAICDRIFNAIKECGASYGEIAAATGIPKSAIHRYATGETLKIPLDRIEKIARATHVSAAYLMGWENNITNSSFFAVPGIQPLPRTNRKPRLGKIACGTPISAVENFEGYDDVPDSVQCDFTLLCQGDSMTGARIYDGDIVYIRQQPTVENGEIAAVIIDGEATLKRFYRKENTVTLMPENPAYAPLVYVNEQLNDIRIVGKAVAFTSMIR